MYNKQVWKDEIPDMTRPILDSSGKQETDPQTGRPLYELVQKGTRITSTRLNHMEAGIEDAHALVEKLASEIGGNFVATIDGEMGLAFTAEGLSVSWTAGIAYVGGKRFEVPAGSMDLNATQGQYLYLDKDGVVKLTTSQSIDEEGLLLFYVATDASSVISTKDQRVNHSLNEILKKLDNIQIPIVDSVTSTETTKAASANAVKTAYDKAAAAETNAKTYIDNKPWQKKQMTADNGAAINISNEDLNTYRDTGFYMGNGLINAPDNNTVDWWYIEQIVHNGDYIIQHAYPLSSVSASNGMRQRRQVNGTWKPWSEDVFQSVSDGKGKLETTITDKGGTVSKAGSVATFDELSSGISTLRGKGSEISFEDLEGDVAPLKGQQTYSLEYTTPYIKSGQGIHLDKKRDILITVGYREITVIQYSTGATIQSWQPANGIRYSAYDEKNGYFYYDPNGSSYAPYRYNVNTKIINDGWTPLSRYVSSCAPIGDGGCVLDSEGSIVVLSSSGEVKLTILPSNTNGMVNFAPGGVTGVSPKNGEIITLGRANTYPASDHFICRYNLSTGALIEYTNFSQRHNGRGVVRFDSNGFIFIISTYPNHLLNVYTPTIGLLGTLNDAICVDVDNEDRPYVMKYIYNSDKSDKLGLSITKHIGATDLTNKKWAYNFVLATEGISSVDSTEHFAVAKNSDRADKYSDVLFQNSTTIYTLKQYTKITN